jgi:hypothetical protein
MPISLLTASFCLSDIYRGPQEAFRLSAVCLVSERVTNYEELIKRREI